MVAGGITVGKKVQNIVKEAQRQQKLLASELQQGRANARKQQKIAVDEQFFRRLMVIMQM